MTPTHSLDSCPVIKFNTPINIWFVILFIIDLKYLILCFMSIFYGDRESDSFSDNVSGPCSSDLDLRQIYMTREDILESFTFALKLIFILQCGQIDEAADVIGRP